MPTYLFITYLLFQLGLLCDDKTPRLNNLGDKSLIGLYFITAHYLRKSGQELKQGRNLEAGADAEAMEGSCLLACSPWLAQSFL